MGGGRIRGSKVGKGLFLEAAVDVTAEVGEAYGAVSEVGEGGREKLTLY
jgi:hypothetical protein